VILNFYAKASKFDRFGIRDFSYFRRSVGTLEKNWSDFLDGDNGALGKLYAEVFEPLVFRAIYYTRESEIAYFYLM
jgi:hypothetical protein